MNSKEKQQKDKIFKDPIYGYISIPRKYIKIIDSPSFQRLRRVSQTSYSPLYSSALHNRFVHSMGVFHLARMATETLRNDADSKRYFKGDSGKEINWDFEYFDVFELAALLHDVGHSPFSHTGEKYFLSGEAYKDSTQIHEELRKLVDDEDFTADINALEVDYANPHEIMSAIIGLQQFPEFFNGNTKARAFFARCITGYQYGNSEKRREIDIKEMLLNCLITLLNSKVIDVDKLDYLIRDAYIIGYDTIIIDYVRLLKALTITNNLMNVNHYELAFHKSAISVIENVIYARDAEKKWIQGHPVVLYESYLVQEIMMHFIEERGEKAFSSQALSSEGVLLDSRNKNGNEGVFVRLLCDDDIVTFAKNQMVDNNIAQQYFDRSLRMHAFWKSEAEFNARILKDMTVTGKKAAKLLVDKTIRPGKEDKVVVVDNQFREMINNQRVKDEQKAREIGRDISINLMECDAQLELIDFLLDYAEKKQLEPQYVIMSASSFNSGFDNSEFKSLLVKFGPGQTWRLDKVIPTLDSRKRDSVKEEELSLFYIFYARNEKEDCDDLCDKLVYFFNSIGKKLENI